MVEFALNLQIDSPDLNNIIGAGQNIILAKPVDSGTPDVIWLSIFPFPNTTVTWEEEYGLYASNTEVREGAVITQISSSPCPALPQHIYPFNPNVQFGPPQLDTGLGSGTYAAENNVSASRFPSLTFGLHQNAMIHGNLTDFQPVNASKVLSTQTAQFTPFTTVFVWLQADIVSRTVITRVMSRHSEVRFGGGVNEHNLKYNPESGLFTPVSEAGALMKDESVLLVEPVIM